MARILEDLAVAYDEFMAGTGDEPPGFGTIPADLHEATWTVGKGEPWGVFDSFGSSNGPLQIQAYGFPDEHDDTPDGPASITEEDAWMLFLSRLNAGEEPYVLTMHALLLANPLEWAALLTWQSSHQLPAGEVDGTWFLDGSVPATMSNVYWSTPEVRAKVVRVLTDLDNPTAAEVVAAFGQWDDSIDREGAFSIASERWDIPYNDLYDAWLASCV